MIRPMLVILLAIISSCNNNSKQQSSNADTLSANTAADTANNAYFPVRSFLKSEIAAVDSMPVGIMRWVSREGKPADSGYIKSQEFHRLASEFIPEEIEEPQFTGNFKETSFFDNTTNTGTFFYSPKSDSSSIKRIDVMSSKGDVYDNIKSIYIEKMSQENGAAVTKKLYWKPGRYFQIIALTSGANGKPISQLTKVVWDNRD